MYNTIRGYCNSSLCRNQPKSSSYWLCKEGIWKYWKVSYRGAEVMVRACVVIFCSPDSFWNEEIWSCYTILKQLQWLPIVKQLEVRDAIMVFKCLNGLAPPYLCQKFKTRSEVHNCNTRNRDRLHIPLCRTAAGQRSFTFRGQRLWNSLPDEFQSITNLDVFKVKIKQHFLRVFSEN